MRVRRLWKGQQILIVVFVNGLNLHIWCFRNARLAGRRCAIFATVTALFAMFAFHARVDLLYAEVQRFETDHARVAFDRFLALATLRFFIDGLVLVRSLVFH